MECNLEIDVRVKSSRVRFPRRARKDQERGNEEPAKWMRFAEIECKSTAAYNPDKVAELFEQCRTE
jgi:hypothetical protein